MTAAHPAAVSLTPVATLYTCFKEKFGIPRQMNLVPDAPGRLVFHRDFADRNAVRELEHFSHIWLIFLFHQARNRNWSALVRPPRMGGNRKAGVFATRSPFRPNPVGISAVKLERVEHTGKGPVLHLSGVDILDATPVLDIKPYLPWADAIEQADGGFAGERPDPGLHVVFSDIAQAQCQSLSGQYPRLMSLITQIVENDPRPGYDAGSSSKKQKIYGVRIFDLDVKWQVFKNLARILSVESI